ncbi:hypothetical protein K0M31_014060 [Melipona bicolor]|uniref:Uncharacterized protein n=1 Tax=Melipona bicolor TaxID=60889 RepID=A0AA40KTS3_9HYME|nr:hypothetical protein K0M31_014060 [Melipona bicolor]
MEILFIDGGVRSWNFQANLSFEAKRRRVHRDCEEENTKPVWPWSNDVQKKFVPPLNFDADRKRAGEGGKRKKEREEDSRLLLSRHETTSALGLDDATMGIQHALEFCIRASSKPPVLPGNSPTEDASTLGRINDSNIIYSPC